MSDATTILIPFLILVGVTILRMVMSKGYRKFEVNFSLAIDGDTLFVGKGYPRIRLFGIDAPEVSQKHGTESCDALRKLIKGEVLIIKPVDKDKYGRIVAQVVRQRDGLDINGAMVADGFALAETSFSKAYKNYERKARRTKSGLWAKGGISSPKYFRQKQNSAC